MIVVVVVVEYLHHVDHELDHDNGNGRTPDLHGATLD